VQKQILRLIEEMQRERGTAILFVTHDLGVVAKISQKVSSSMPARWWRSRYGNAVCSSAAPLHARPDGGNARYTDPGVAKAGRRCRAWPALPPRSPPPIVTEDC